jgi:predicted transcriptional regulator
MQHGYDITREALDALVESLHDFQDFEEAFGAIEW